MAHQAWSSPLPPRSLDGSLPPPAAFPAPSALPQPHGLSHPPSRPFPAPPSFFSSTANHVRSFSTSGTSGENGRGAPAPPPRLSPVLSSSHSQLDSTAFASLSPHSLSPSMSPSSPVSTSCRDSDTALLLPSRIAHRSVAGDGSRARADGGSVSREKKRSEMETGKGKSDRHLLAGSRLHRRWQRIITAVHLPAAVLTLLLLLLPSFLVLQLFHASSLSPPSDSAASRPPSWETANGLNVTYTLRLTNLLPLASASDSAGTAIAIKGRYADGTAFEYPLCSFLRVCASSSHVLLSFANYSVHAFYSAAVAYCSDALYRKFPLCGCFHAGYRPVVLPFAFQLTDEEKKDGDRVAKALLLSRFGKGEWASSKTREPQQVGVAREIPTLEELQSLPAAASGRLFPELFPVPPPAASVSLLSSPSSPFAVRLLASHWWSIHKWVNLHHIAHWAQKMLVLQATYAHYAHACRHSFRRTAKGEREELEELTEDSGSHEAEQQQQPQHDDWAVECLPELSGVLCHDTFSPLTEHEANIYQITVDALQGWVQTLGDDLSDHSHLPAAAIAARRLLSLHPDVPASSALHAPLSASFSPPTSTIYAADLFTVYPAAYLSDIERWQRQLPPPVNTHILSCFARLSFSPMFGTFADNAYDVIQWRRQAMAHYGLGQHRQHNWRDVDVRVWTKEEKEAMTLPPTDRPVDSARHLLTMDAETLQSPHSQQAFTLASLASAVLPPPSRPALSRPSASPSSSSPSTFSNSLALSASSAVSLSSCPPSAAVLIYRPDRSILNQGELLSFLKQRYNLLVSLVTVDGSTSSREQARIFSSAGLILSAHSSQMVNVVFAHQSAALVEVTGEYYNLDFARYATSVGVYFRYAIGGVFPDAAKPEDPLMRHCIDSLHACRGDNFCIGRRAERNCRQYTYFPNKNLPYYANLTALDTAVRQALGHIMKHCYGKWQDVRLAALT